MVQIQFLISYPKSSNQSTPSITENGGKHDKHSTAWTAKNSIYYNFVKTSIFYILINCFSSSKTLTRISKKLRLDLKTKQSDLNKSNQ